MDPFWEAAVKAVAGGAVGAAGALWGRSLLLQKSQERADERHDELAEKHDEDVAALREENAELRESLKAALAEMRGSVNTLAGEVRAGFSQLSEKVNSTDRKLDTFTVALVGVDGKNGIRGDVRVLQQESKGLLERVMTVDFAQREDSRRIDQLDRRRSSTEGGD